MDPLHLPLTLLQWLASLVPNVDHVLLARLPSVLLALLTIAMFAYLLYRWYGRRSMAFGVALLATSAWMLHIGRFAGPEVEYAAAIFGLLLAHISLHDSPTSKRTWFAWLALHTLLLFIPGMVWFALANAAWQWRDIASAWKSLALWQRTISIIIPVIAVGGVAASLAHDHALILLWLGAPDGLSALRNFPPHTLDTLSYFVLRGPNQPALWLGQLPLLDVFTLIMFLAGVVFYAKHWRAARTQLLAFTIALGLILCGLGGIGFSVLLAPIYLVAVAGIAYALYFWLQRFPRNLLARWFGIGIVAAVLAFACYYNLIQYFVAWPHNPDVVAIYQRQR